MVARGFNEEVGAPAEGAMDVSEESDVDDEKVSDIRKLCRSSKRGSSALDYVKPLCDYLFLPVPTTIVKVPQ